MTIVKEKIEVFVIAKKDEQLARIGSGYIARRCAGKQHVKDWKNGKCKPYKTRPWMSQTNLRAIEHTSTLRIENIQYLTCSELEAMNEIASTYTAYYPSLLFSMQYV